MSLLDDTCSSGESANIDSTYPQFTVIVASTLEGGIGLKGGIPWRIPPDMKFFKETTSKVTSDESKLYVEVSHDITPSPVDLSEKMPETGNSSSIVDSASLSSSGAEPEKMNVVIMGRKTYFSIPEKLRPLTSRINIIVSRNVNLKEAFRDPSIPDSVIVACSLTQALLLAKENVKSAEIFVCGGGEIYREAVTMKSCRRILLTRIERLIPCDTFFPTIDSHSFHTTKVSDLFMYKEIPFKFVAYERT